MVHATSNPTHKPLYLFTIIYLAWKNWFAAFLLIFFDGWSNVPIFKNDDAYVKKPMFSG